jgi:hypothetical protein
LLDLLEVVEELLLRRCFLLLDIVECCRNGCGGGRRGGKESDEVECRYPSKFSPHRHYLAHCAGHAASSL